jgi:hypothetical protein
MNVMEEKNSPQAYRQDTGKPSLKKQVAGLKPALPLS